MESTMDEKEARMENFRKSFTKMVKNREVLCDAKGRLKKENLRYKVKYQELVDQVAKSGTKICEDAIWYFYFPQNEQGKECIKKVEEVMKNMVLQFRTIILSGTFDEFLDQVEKFRKESLEIYLGYVGRGMHADLYKKEGKA